MRARLSIVSVMAVASCFSTAQYDKANKERLDEIDQRYSDQRVHETKTWNALLDQIDEERKFLVAIKPDSNYSPVERVDASPTILGLRKVCDDAAADATRQPAELVEQYRKIANDCYASMIREQYLPILQRHYFEADINWISTQLDHTPNADLEALFAYSHNTRILIQIAQQRASVEASKQKALADLASMQATEEQLSNEQHDQEVEAARERHREMLAAVLQGVAQGLNQSQHTSSPTQGAPIDTGCASDFSCGVGFTCVKDYYAATGHCAKAVNEYGAQTFSGPNLDSVGPNMPVATDCNSLGCPGAFRCDLNSGRCVQ